MFNTDSDQYNLQTSQATFIEYIKGYLPYYQNRVKKPNFVR